MKTLAEVKKILQKNKSYLEKKYYIREIGIFGSFSRGEQKENSDIDLIVKFNRTLGLEFVDLSIELKNILKHKVDLVSRNAIKKRHYDVIKNEIIYV